MENIVTNIHRRSASLQSEDRTTNFNNSSWELLIKAKIRRIRGKNKLRNRKLNVYSRTTGKL